MYVFLAWVPFLRRHYGLFPSVFCTFQCVFLASFRLPSLRVTMVFFLTFSLVFGVYLLFLFSCFPLASPWPFFLAFRSRCEAVAKLSQSGLPAVRLAVFRIVYEVVRKLLRSCEAVPMALRCCCEAVANSLQNCCNVGSEAAKQVPKLF